MSDGVSNINDISKALPPKEVGLQSLAKAVCTERLHTLEEQAREEVTQVKGRQARMRFLNQATRIVNAAESDKNGDLDLEKHVDLKKLQDNAKDIEAESAQLESEAEALEREAEELARNVQDSNDDAAKTRMNAEAAGKNKQAKVKRDEAAELKDIRKAIEILANKKKLTKEEKSRLLESCRSCFEDLNSINQLQMQSANRLNQERHETLLMARLIMKTLHDDIVHKARAISGRG